MIDYKSIARKLVDDRYPTCQGALMTGSIVRGQATETSDIDLLIYDQSLEGAFRESLMYEGVPVEVFAHNQSSFSHYFDSDCQRKMPSLLLMVVEGEIIRACPYFKTLKEEAQTRLDLGPEPLTGDDLETMRYFITDLKEDLIGSRDDFESLLIVNELLVKLHELYLLNQGAWIGKAKWIKRALINHDEEFAAYFEGQVLTYYQTREKQVILDLVTRVLEPLGGDLFHGYSRGKKKK